MELKIYSPTEDGFVREIRWNHEEIKKEVSEKVSYYSNLVYSDDQIKEAKADRAKLNKFVQALEAKRKEVKKQCLAPYEEFEKKMKEIIAIVNEPIQMIDSQVKGYEEQKKAEKLEQIQEYWDRVTSPDHPLTLQRVMETRWLNATTSMKSIQESITGILAKYAEDIATLQNLPEYAFEAIEVYKTTLNLSNAVNQAHTLAEQAKRKAEYEAEQARLKAEAEFAKCMNPPEAEKPVTEEPKNEAPVVPERAWIGFKALLTEADAQALAQLFAVRGIEYEQIKL